jgi:arsenite methyltransferase
MSDRLIDTVQSQYAAVARSGLSNDSPAVRAVAQAFGYSAEDLASLPPEANMGLSCGNPIALAGLRPGEVVLDLGCGGGLDVLLAARRVGSTGKAIGIDMTADMIERARTGAARVGATNVEFHLAQIDQLPLADASVDCVLSNCVINLVPDKARAFREIFRVLKPGGRIAISDIALRRPLPPAVASDVQAHVGCIAGALLMADYERMLREAGFASVVISDSGADLNIYAQSGSGGCCSTDSGGCCTSTEGSDSAPPLHAGLTKVLREFDANSYAASVRVHAIKAPVTEQREINQGDKPMKSVQVFDKPMCCSTGVCGPDIDPTLLRFAADLQWLQQQGHRVERFNLAQQPAAFAENNAVLQAVAAQGAHCLPIVVVDDRIVSQREYPTRERLAAWVGDGALEGDDERQEVPCCGRSPCC